jgi:chromosome segregation ATPase
LNRGFEKGHNPKAGERMSEDTTQETPDARSFEERVFARFDAMDARFDVLDTRLTALEEKVEARLQETRPIWEAVLSRLDNIDGEIKSVNRRVRVLHDDILRVREDQEDLRERVSKLESEPSH